MEGTYVRGPLGTNAVYPVVRRKFVGQTAAKVVSLADIYRLPSEAVGLAKDIDSRKGEVAGANLVVFKLVDRALRPSPVNDDREGQ
jgi:hypothetical protein